MNCPDCVERIAQKLDGTLPVHLEAELEEHVSRCSRCRAEWVLQEKIRDALSQEIPSELSPSFTQRVCRRAFEASTAQRRLEKLGDLVPLVPILAGAVLAFWFRNDLAQIVPPLAETLQTALAAPLAATSHAVAEFLAGAANLPSEHIPMLERISRPLMTTLTATLVGLVPALWALSRVLAFLRE